MKGFVTNSDDLLAIFPLKLSPNSKLLIMAATLFIDYLHYDVKIDYKAYKFNKKNFGRKMRRYENINLND